MNQDLRVLEFKSFERLLMHRGFLICQESGEKITRLRDLAVIQLIQGEKQILLLPVHKKYVHQLMESVQEALLDGTPALDEDAFLKFEYRD